MDRNSVPPSDGHLSPSYRHAVLISVPYQTVPIYQVGTLEAVGRIFLLMRSSAIFMLQLSRGLGGRDGRGREPK